MKKAKTEAKPKTEEPREAVVKLTPLEAQRLVVVLKSTVREWKKGANCYAEQKLILEYGTLIAKIDAALMKAEDGALAFKMRFIGEHLAVAGE